MTVTDFFLKQTAKEIKEKFREVGLDKYYNFPESVKDLCKMFNLENKKELDHYFTIKRHSCAEVYTYFILPNTAYPDTPLRIEAHFYVTSSKGACSITRGLESHIDTIKKVSDIFDNRPDYNNIVFRVWNSRLPEIFDEIVDDFNEEKKYYKLKKEKTIWDYYEAVCEYTKEAIPIINAFIDGVKDGTVETIWNNILPNKKWVKGGECNKAMFFPVYVDMYNRVCKAGKEMSLTDFIYFMAALDCNSIHTPESFIEQQDIINNRYSSNKEIIEAFDKIIKAFRENISENDDYKKWCDVYEKANKEMYDEVAALTNRISNKYNINTRWLEIFHMYYRNKDDIQWKRHNIPQDAYAE